MVERRLGALEHVVAVADRAAPINFVMVADLRGPIDHGALRAALDAMQRLHPITRMAIAPAGRRLRFADGAPPIPLRHIEADAAAVPGICADEANTRFDEAEGPLLRTVCVDTGPDRSTLLLVFHHSIGDGTAGAFLLRDLLRAMIEPPDDGPLPAAIEEHLPPATMGLRGTLAHLGFIGRVFRRLWALRGIPGYRVPDGRQAEPSECRAHMVRRDLMPARVSALAAAAKANGTTVHGAIGAAVLLAAHAHGDGRAVMGLGSPVNLRGRLAPPVGTDVGLFITMVAGLHRIDDSLDPWDLAREVRGELKGMIDTGDVFAAIPYQARILARIAPWLGSGLAGARRFVGLMRSIWLDGVGLSNLGRLAIDTRYGAVEVGAVGFCAAPTIFGDLAAFCATLDGHLCLHVAGVEPHIPVHVTEAIADDIVARMKAMAES